MTGGCAWFVTYATGAILRPHPYIFHLPLGFTYHGGVVLSTRLFYIPNYNRPLEQTVEVLWKPIMDWIKEVLQNPYLYSHIHWYPERVFVQDDDGRWMQRVDEPWTGDDLWGAWVKYFIYL